MSGSAFGESVDLTRQVQGSPVTVTSGPVPEVTLPADGGGPLTAGALEADAPGVLHTGVLEVSTQGTTGPGGSANSSTALADVTVEYDNLLTAGAVQSSCTADERGVSGQTTILDLAAPGTAGTVANYQPGPNTTFTLPGGATVVFNEQILTDEGENSAITVNAVHVIIDNQLTGTEGDIILAQSRCDVTTAPGPEPTPTTEATTPTTEATTPTTVVTTPTTEAPGNLPTSKDQCKKGGWENVGFKNQGQCVSFVASGGRSGGPP